MKIQRKIHFLKLTISVVGILLFFLVFAPAKAQFTQCWNGNWTEPSCDPLTDLSCNVSPPIFSYANCLQGTSGELRIFKYNADSNELDDISQNPANWVQIMPGYIGVGDVQSGWVPYSVSNYGYGNGIVQINQNLLVGHFTSQPSGTFTGGGDAVIQYDLNVGKQLRVDGSGATSYIYAPLQVLPGTISGDGLFIQGLGFDSTDNVVRISNTAGGGGQGTVLYLQQDGGDFGRFIKMDGWSNDVDIDYMGYFNSTGDFQIRIDRDNNSINYFRLNNGANSTVLQVNESGDLLAQGDVTTNSRFCLGVDCINSWDNTGYWSMTGSNLHPNNTSWNVGIGTNDAQSYKLYVNGDAYSTGSWNSSDIRLKTDIKTLTNILDKVMKLRAVSFRWRDNDNFNLPVGRQLGLIAQEVEQYFPELVKEDGHGYKSLDYGKLTAVLLEAIKEQQKQINDLTSRVERLEKIINNNQ